MKKSFFVFLLLLVAQTGAHAQTTASPKKLAIAQGQKFHCRWAQPPIAEGPIVCLISQPILRVDKVSIAIGVGSWLNGQYVGKNLIEWKAVQTGHVEGSYVFELPKASLTSTVIGAEGPGAELLVSVNLPLYFSEELSPPKALSGLQSSGIERPAFYQALMKISSSEARQTFMVDQLLAERCGKPQTLTALKDAVSSSDLFVLRSLKAGDISAARAALSNLQCER